LAEAAVPECLLSRRYWGASLLGWPDGAGKAALIVSSIGLGLRGAALGLAWLACGRDLLTGPALASLALNLKIKAGI
jgi:hypothetical protein